MASIVFNIAPSVTRSPPKGSNPLSLASAAPCVTKFPVSRGLTGSYPVTYKKTPYGLPKALYIDSGLFAVNKIAGFECQPVSQKNLKKAFEGMYSGGSSKRRAMDFSSALEEWKEVYGLDQQPIPIHRLDKPTTGILLLARNERSARAFATLFRQRKIEKTYLALVDTTNSEVLRSERRGTIQTPLVFKEDGRIQLGETAFTREARTDWEVIGTSPRYPLALLKVRLHTGLKHQIRIHVAQILKAHVHGDSLYRQIPDISNPSSIIPNPSGAVHLHSSQISLHRYYKEGPKKRYRLSLTAPLPATFKVLCNICEIRIPREYLRRTVSVDGIVLNRDEEGESESERQKKVGRTLHLF